MIYGGDVLDEDVSPVERKKIGYDLLSYKAPLGVYAVTGNHEYIGGAPHAVSFLKSFGIVVLQDEWVIIDSSLIIAGRKDKDGARFGVETEKQCMNFSVMYQAICRFYLLIINLLILTKKLKRISF